MALLNGRELTENVKELDGWNVSENNLVKEFVFPDFKSAVAFVVKVGMSAEKANHHPDILLHGWNKVKFTLSTHSENGITLKDIDLAKEINKLYGE